MRRRHPGAGLTRQYFQMKEIAYEKIYKLEDTHWWFRARARIIHSLIRRYASRPPISALDYGCGAGKMLREMAPLGDVWGLDTSATALDFCRRRGLSNLIGPEKGLDPDARFDLITLLDVVEHVDDDAALLRSLKAHLSPNGKIIMTAPAYKFLWGGEDYISAHKRRYVRKQLVRAAEAAGLRVLRVSYFNTLLLIPTFLYIRLKALIDPESMKKTYIWNVPEPLNTVLFGIFSIELHLLKLFDLPAGVSIFCVAENPESN